MMVRNYFNFNVFPLIVFFTFLLLTAAVLPAGAQFSNDPGSAPTQTPTPTAALPLRPELTETPVPEEYYLPKIFVPTNTPSGELKSERLPYDTNLCKDNPRPECDILLTPITQGDSTASLSRLEVHLKNAPSYTGTFGNIYRNTCDESTACYLIDLESSKPSINLATVYDTSAGTTGINVTNEQSTLNAVALNSLSDQNIDTYLLNISVDLFNKKNNAEIISKAVNVTQTGSEAAINVFGDASVKIYPDNILGNIKANTLTANPVELTAKGGKINMNVGAVRTDILNAENITAEGVKITAENNTENNTQGLVTFTSGRQWYYHVNKWIREGEEKLVVDPKYLSTGNDTITFDNPSNVIENIESFTKTLLFKNDLFEIYFLENKSTGEILYALKDSENIYFEAIMTAGTYKQCEPAYPGNITVSAAGSNISAHGAHLTTKAGENTIHFETTNGGQISVTADGSVKNAYGLYTDSDGGTITALIEGSITESSNTETALGNTAGILMAGKSGEVNIQVGVVPDEPPVGEKEIKVSGSQVGIYNTSPDGQTKNVVIFGTVTGGTAPILTDSTGGSSFTLAAWGIDLKNGNVAFTKQNGTLAPDTEFEENIRYILLADPSIRNNVTFESAGTDKARAIEENKSTGTIQGYCESEFNGGYGKNLREEKGNFYIQNLKENTETYNWANAGKTVTLKSSKEGYHITEAYWRDGKNEADKMACLDGVCTFTVPMGGGVWIHDVKMAKDAAVTITGNPETIYYGDSFELSASVTPEEPGTWTWSSSDPSAAVTQDGKVSILSVSTSPITITAEYKSTSGSEDGKGSIELTVLPRPVTVTAKDQTIRQGEEIDKDIDQAELTGALSGHDLSAVTLTSSGTSEVSDNSTITVSDAKISDGAGIDVTDNYAITYNPGKLTVLHSESKTVTFKAVNGAWDDGSTNDKIIYLRGYEGDVLKLSDKDIPTVGNKPDTGFQTGSWDTVPDTETAITEDTVYTYTYAELYADKYITVAGENQDHEIGSGQDAVFIIERIVNDDLTYPLFRTIVQLKNSKNELFRLRYPDDYDYEEGSLIVKLHADYLDNLPPDNYTLRAFFEDGIYEIHFTISEESPYKLNVELNNSQNNGNKGTPDGIKILPLVVKISIIQNGKVISESKMCAVNLDGSEDNETFSIDVSFLSAIPDLTDGSYNADVSISPVNITLGGVEYKLSAKAHVDSNGKILVDLLWDDNSRNEEKEEEKGLVFYLLPFYEYGLPATGFSSLFTETLSEQPKALNYEPVHLHLQIPTLNLETELVTVPLMDDSWQVAWLGNRAGILEGSALPGEGYSFIAAHNTLNSEEYGPFALLSTMAINDLITVNSEDGTMSLFRVYANEVIGANDVEKMERVAEQEADSLVLITCENESVEGGYLDRRIIFAKPL